LERNLSIPAELLPKNPGSVITLKEVFPRISLATAVGNASAELSGLFRAGSDTWSFVPQIIMPIFDAGVWSAYDATKFEKEIAVA